MCERVRVDGAGAHLYLHQLPGSGGAARGREGCTLSVNPQLPSSFSGSGALLKGACATVDCLAVGGYRESSFCHDMRSDLFLAVS